MAAFAVAFIAVLLAQPAEARSVNTKYQVQKHRVIRDVAPSYAAHTEQFSARRHSVHRRHYTRRSGGSRHYARRGGGACDGFQRCRCGTTAARHFGLPYSYKGFNLKLAWEWQRAFPHTSFHVGVAGVRPHHVLAVIGGSNCSNATISDDAGTRQRNVCGFTFVEVGGGGFTNTASAQTHRHHSRIRHRENYQQFTFNGRSDAY